MKRTSDTVLRCYIICVFLAFGEVAMSRTELAEKMERLSGDDFNIVVMLVDRLLEKQDGLPRLSEDQLVNEMMESITKSNAGFTRPAREVSEEMRATFEIPFAF